jgi:hypothetical protein
MNSKARKPAAILRDVGRLIAPLDILYTVGNLIYRRSLRYTLVTAGISLVGMVAKLFHLPGFTVRQAIVLPLVIGGLSLVFGSLLKIVPSLISSRLMTVAQASDLNLMEDYRKSEAAEHLDALWERLFRHECALRLAAGKPVFEGCAHGAGDGGADAPAGARAEFLARAGEALRSHLPQIRQMHLLGLDLRYFEDWRDGAYLDRSDTKLAEQFQGNSTLVAARREAGMNRPAVALVFRPRCAAQRLWFLFVTRMVAIQVGSAVQRLNRQYDTDLFNSQVLLWPGEEDEAWLGAFEGARDEVLRRRTQAIRRIFGADFATASDVLDHMLYCGFAMATELRLRYDPDYCDGRLGYDVIADLRAEGRNRRDFQRAEAFVRRARDNLEALDQFLARHRPELLEPARGEDLRAVRVAAHVDSSGTGRLVSNALRDGAQEATDEALAAIDAAAGEMRLSTRRLIAVRMHHELTRLCRQGYRKLIERLAYGD